MRNLNDRIGWGVVGLAVVALFFVVNGQDRERFPHLLPEAELRVIAWHSLPTYEGFIYRIESAVVSEAEWSRITGSLYPGMSEDEPVLIYRAYGDFRQVYVPCLDTCPDYYFQMIEVAVDGNTGIIKEVSTVPKHVTPYDLFSLPVTKGYVLPMVPTVAPYLMPTRVWFEATEEID
jgi:hypothetical protein